LFLDSLRDHPHAAAEAQDYLGKKGCNTKDDGDDLGFEPRALPQESYRQGENVGRSSLLLLVLTAGCAVLAECAVFLALGFADFSCATFAFWFKLIEELLGVMLRQL
jgi:hypothetical protein